MATRGSQLTQPEEGWTRIDDSSDIFTYTGSWGTQSSSGYYNGFSKQIFNAASSGKISFSFSGTAIRILGTTLSNGNQDTDIRVAIDGVTYKFSNQSPGGTMYQVILYEKLDLTPGEHTVTITQGSRFKLLAFDGIDIVTDEYYPKVKIKLLEPDPGWNRYNDSDGLIEYSGNEWIVDSVPTSSYYNKDIHHLYQNKEINEVRFNFYGTGLRIIGVIVNNGNEDENLKVFIDGEQFTFNNKNTLTSQGSTEGQMVLFDKTELEEKEHEIVIRKEINDKAFWLDAIDLIGTMVSRKRYLFFFNGEYHYFSTEGNSWISAGNEMTYEKFQDFGNTSLNFLPDVIGEITDTNFSICLLGDLGVPVVNMEMKGVPESSLVVDKEPILFGENSSINSLTVNSDSLRVLVSPGSGGKWYDFRDRKFIEKDLNGLDLSVDGFQDAQMYQSEWKRIMGENNSLMLAYILSYDEGESSMSIDIEYLPFGGWKSLPAGREVRTVFDMNGNLSVEVYESGDYKVNYPKTKPKAEEEEFWDQFDL
jgi:hypothetical protein